MTKKKSKMCKHPKRFKVILGLRSWGNEIRGYRFSIIYCKKCGMLKEINKRFY